MISVYQLKPRFQDLLRPGVRMLANLSVRANHVTIVAMVISMAYGLLMFQFPQSSILLLALPLLLLLRMGLNAVDGMLAREHDQKSPLGAILNELGDVVSDMALYLPLMFSTLIPDPALVLAVLVGVLTEMIGVVAVQIGASRRYDGPVGKSDRALGFGVIGLLLGLGFPGGYWVDIMLWIMTLGGVWTVFNRGRKALDEVHV